MIQFMSAEKYASPARSKPSVSCTTSDNAGSLGFEAACAASSPSAGGAGGAAQPPGHPARAKAISTAGIIFIIVSRPIRIMAL
jgi:hypothetical protein